ncbi:hypothetical protein BC781_106161 [Sediminitomix flava]|uniref:Uncharacterized protein n=1 Tax=Sediminitomix flava TaxID=379075 RepID=A0A315Z7T8_SEDFL|nr:hypothetical protein BC781_106161 [Sediminitomix flava]
MVKEITINDLNELHISLFLLQNKVECSQIPKFILNFLDEVGISVTFIFLLLHPMFLFPILLPSILTNGLSYENY